MQQPTSQGDLPHPLLKQIPLFSDLSDADLNILSDGMTRRTFRKDVFVINEEDISNALYIIISGRVNITKTHEDGKEVVIAILKEGDYFGEMAVIDEEPRSASVVTREISELFVLRTQDFHSILTKNPLLALKIMRGLTRRLRQADRKIESLALMDVYGRIARVFLDLAKPKGDALVIEEKLTHQDIANMVGSSREMVSRIVRDLVHGGYIEIDKKIITIKGKLPAAW